MKSKSGIRWIDAEGVEKDLDAELNKNFSSEELRTEYAGRFTPPSIPGANRNVIIQGVDSTGDVIGDITQIYNSNGLLQSHMTIQHIDAGGALIGCAANYVEGASITYGYCSDNYDNSDSSNKIVTTRKARQLTGDFALTAASVKSLGLYEHNIYIRQTNLGSSEGMKVFVTVINRDPAQYTTIQKINDLAIGSGGNYLQASGYGYYGTGFKTVIALYNYSNTNTLSFVFDASDTVASSPVTAYEVIDRVVSLG